MRMLVLIAGTIFAVCLANDYAQAQAGTCSGARDACRKTTAGRSPRGVPSGNCDLFHEQCMRTGVWDSSILNSSGIGVRRSGMAKK
jgi:hypothetical protein